MLRGLIFWILLATGAPAQQMVIAPQFDKAGTFHAGIAPVQVNGQWGFVDRSGRMVVSPQFSAVQPGRDGLHPALTEFSPGNASWSFIRPDGQAVANAFGGKIRNFKLGWAAIDSYVPEGEPEKWYIIDTKGDRVSSTPFEAVLDWEPPFAIVRADGQLVVVHISEYGYVNAVENYARDELGVPTGWSDFRDGFFVSTSSFGKTLLRLIVEQHRPEPSLWTAIREEAARSPKFFASLSSPREGYAAVEFRDGIWAYYHFATGKYAWVGRFDAVRSFYQGYAAVQQNGKWGYINRRGEMVVQPTYDRAYDFREGFATVRRGDLRGFMAIDPARGIIEYIAPQFQDVFRFREGLAPVKVGGKWGYVSTGSPPEPDYRQSGIEVLVPD